MLVTLDTAHFERSLLNADAPLNAVQIIQKQEYNKEKKRQKNKYQRKNKIGNNISDTCIVCFNKMENGKIKEQFKKKRRQRIKNEMVTYYETWW